MSLIVDEHRQYLADKARISAFRQAIGELVKPGDVVLDLGAGTGIMGLLSCRAGAERVYSIDDGGMIELAREICQINNFQDRVTFIKGLSTRVELPEKVDVVVADQIGRFGFEAGVLEYFSDARKRFLKPGGVLIPSRIDMCIAPVECPEIFAQIDFWNNSPAGFNFEPAWSIAANTGYPVKFRPDHILGDPVAIASLDLSVLDATPLTLDTSLTAARSGTLHGVGGWFSAQLCTNVVMSNSPFATQPIKRKNVFFPISRPVMITKDDRIRVTMHIVPTETMVTWKIEVCGNDGTRMAAFNHSTFRGMLICKEDLKKTQPHFIPRLSPWGEARRSVITLCDGKRTLSEIEQQIFHRHPQLFPSCSEAAEFVAEVVTRYSI